MQLAFSIKNYNFIDPAVLQTDCGSITTNTSLISIKGPTPQQVKHFRSGINIHNKNNN